MSKTAIESFIEKWLVGYESLEQKLEFEIEMKSDLAELSTPCEELRLRTEKDSDSLNVISIEYNKRFRENEELKKRISELETDFKLACNRILTFENLEQKIAEKQQRISELEREKETLKEGLNDLRLSIVDKNFYNSHATALANAKKLLNL